MTTTTATPAAETPAEPSAEPTTGVKAATRYLTDHLTKEPTPPAAEPSDEDDDEDDEDDDEESAKDKDKPKPKRSVAHKLKSKRRQVRELRGEVDQYKKKLSEMEAAVRAKPPAADLSALAKENLLAALERIGVTPEEALDALQKAALTGASVPPALRKVIEQQRQEMEALKKKVAGVDEAQAEREQEAAHQQGMAELRAEYAKLDRYPEFEGEKPEVIEEACRQACELLAAQGRKTAPAEEVLGMVHNAFAIKNKEEEERVQRRAAKRAGAGAGAGATGKPAPAAAPPRRKETRRPEPEEPELDPVTPSKKGKVKLPSMEEITRRALRASQGQLTYLLQSSTALTASLRWSSSRPKRCPAHADRPATSTPTPKVLPCLLDMRISPQPKTR